MEPLDTASIRRSPPGALRGHVRLTVQTLHAQRLIWGRPAQPGVPVIIGLVGYADRLRLIWQGVAADDPYADWFLLRVETSLEQVRGLIKAERAAIPVCDGDAIEIELAASTRPARIELRFATPYAYRAAYLLGQFDAHARRLLTARHVGLVAPDAVADSLRRCAHAIRGSFAIAQPYRSFGIDRPGYREGSPAVEKARARLGEVPTDVLEGRTVAAVRPRPATRSSELIVRTAAEIAASFIDDVAVLEGNDGNPT